MNARIEAVLEGIRPALARHRGDVELVSFHEGSGVVFVRFKGTCVNCPLSEMTLKAGIESVLREAIPEIKEVISVL